MTSRHTRCTYQVWAKLFQPKQTPSWEKSRQSSDTTHTCQNVKTHAETPKTRLTAPPITAVQQTESRCSEIDSPCPKLSGVACKSRKQRYSKGRRSWMFRNLRRAPENCTKVRARKCLLTPYPSAWDAPTQTSCKARLCRNACWASRSGPVLSNRRRKHLLRGSHDQLGPRRSSPEGYW